MPTKIRVNDAWVQGARQNAVLGEAWRSQQGLGSVEARMHTSQ